VPTTVAVGCSVEATMTPVQQAGADATQQLLSTTL
jgi:hypothetical protein